MKIHTYYCLLLIFTHSVFYSETMQTAEARLQTFKDWPNAHIKPQDLANAGFYYTGICFEMPINLTLAKTEIIYPKNVRA